MIDKNGYPRKCVYHSDLIHRQIAYNEIYLKNKDKYPLPFSKYQVHHKDHNKKNFNVENLQLLTKDEHEKIHGLSNKDFIKSDNRNFAHSTKGENKAFELLTKKDLNNNFNEKEFARKRISDELTYAQWKNDMGENFTYGNSPDYSKTIVKAKWRKMRKIPFWLKSKIRNGKAYRMGHGQYIFNGTFNKYFIDIDKMLCCKTSKYRMK